MGGEMDRRQSVRLRGYPADGIVTALAAGDGGYVLVGWATPDGSAGKDIERHGSESAETENAADDERHESLERNARVHGAGEPKRAPVSLTSCST